MSCDLIPLFRTLSDSCKMAQQSVFTLDTMYVTIYIMLHCIHYTSCTSYIVHRSCINAPRSLAHTQNSINHRLAHVKYILFELQIQIMYGYVQLCYLDVLFAASDHILQRCIKSVLLMLEKSVFLIKSTGFSLSLFSRQLF